MSTPNVIKIYNILNEMEKGASYKEACEKFGYSTNFGYNISKSFPEFKEVKKIIEYKNLCKEAYDFLIEYQKNKKIKKNNYKIKKWKKEINLFNDCYKKIKKKQKTDLKKILVK